MAKKIVITSGKGGVGKTTVTANLGRSLAKRGNRVIMMDLDFGLNNLDVVMGIENRVVYDMADVFNGRCRVKQALVQDTNFPNLYVLPSDGLNSNSEICGGNIKDLVESLDVFDYILIDCPAGIDIGFHRAVSIANQAIVVTTSNLPSLRDADKVVSILKSYNLESVGVVVNRVRGDLILSEKMIEPRDIESMLKIELYGILPEEDAVFLSSGITLPKNCDSFKAYKILANNIETGSRKIYNTLRKYSGFFGSIRRSIKKGI